MGGIRFGGIAIVNGCVLECSIIHGMEEIEELLVFGAAVDRRRSEGGT